MLFCTQPIKLLEYLPILSSPKREDTCSSLTLAILATQTKYMHYTKQEQNPRDFLFRNPENKDSLSWEVLWLQNVKLEQMIICNFLPSLTYTLLAGKWKRKKISYHVVSPLLVHLYNVKKYMTLEISFKNWVWWLKIYQFATRHLSCIYCTTSARVSVLLLTCTGLSNVR